MTSGERMEARRDECRSESIDDGHERTGRRGESNLMEADDERTQRVEGTSADDCRDADFSRGRHPSGGVLAEPADGGLVEHGSCVGNGGEISWEACSWSGWRIGNARWTGGGRDGAGRRISTGNAEGLRGLRTRQMSGTLHGGETVF